MSFFSLVIDHVFRIFPFFSQIFRVFPVLNVVYDPFLTRKTTISEKIPLMTPFFLLCSNFSRPSDNTTFQNIGEGRMHGPFPLKFLGDRPPVPPRSPPLVTYNTCMRFLILHTQQFLYTKTWYVIGIVCWYSIGIISLHSVGNVF